MVTTVQLREGAPHELTVTVRGEEPETVRCGLLIDASGQHRLVANALELTTVHEDLRNIATWAYYDRCETLAGERAGDALVENRPDGWLWFIPLLDGTTSIGYVTHVATFRDRNLEPLALLERERTQSSEVARLTKSATRVSSVRSARDWSYEASRFSGADWLLAGDAAAFVDPLFSTGVTLAMWAGARAAEAADEMLRAPETSDRAAAAGAYDAQYRAFFAQVLIFVRFFYNTSMRKEDYWNRAQEIVDPQGVNEPHIDFATLVSGLFGGQPNLEVINERRAEYARAFAP